MLEESCPAVRGDPGRHSQGEPHAGRLPAPQYTDGKVPAIVDNRGPAASDAGCSIRGATCFTSRRPWRFIGGSRRSAMNCCRGCLQRPPEVGPFSRSGVAFPATRRRKRCLTAVNSIRREIERHYPGPGLHLTARTSSSGGDYSDRGHVLWGCSRGARARAGPARMTACRVSESQRPYETVGARPRCGAGAERS